MKKTFKKLSLCRETLTRLNPDQQARIEGGAIRWLTGICMTMLCTMQCTIHPTCLPGCPPPIIPLPPATPGEVPIVPL